ncbi:class I SAM-dependent methyltransferase, partial [Klebsiella pneumoniae]|uniref:class I SAM-dependent methyltransferase n=1 Tax=Klebsiella pneumoniae TaxID=573 RepID=UPI003C6D69E1
MGSSGRIIAVDYSDGMLDAARAAAENNGWHNIDFIQADATALSLPPQSLDGALCTFGLSAMPGERQALLRVAQSLKGGA